MPYIDKNTRAELDPELRALTDKIRRAPYDVLDGVLNYVISRIVAGSLNRTGWRYRLIARAIAVFEAAKLEFYRRVAAPYEHQAIGKSGDIPEYE